MSAEALVYTVFTTICLLKTFGFLNDSISPILEEVETVALPTRTICQPIDPEFTDLSVPIEMYWITASLFAYIALVTLLAGLLIAGKSHSGVPSNLYLKVTEQNATLQAQGKLIDELKIQTSLRMQQLMTLEERLSHLNLTIQSDKTSITALKEEIARLQQQLDNSVPTMPEVTHFGTQTTLEGHQLSSVEEDKVDRESFKRQIKNLKQVHKNVLAGYRQRLQSFAGTPAEVAGHQLIESAMKRRRATAPVSTTPFPLAPDASQASSSFPTSESKVVARPNPDQSIDEDDLGSPGLAQTTDVPQRSPAELTTDSAPPPEPATTAKVLQASVKRSPVADESRSSKVIPAETATATASHQIIPLTIATSTLDSPIRPASPPPAQTVQSAPAAPATSVPTQLDSESWTPVQRRRTSPPHLDMPIPLAGRQQSARRSPLRVQQQQQQQQSGEGTGSVVGSGLRRGSLGRGRGGRNPLSGSKYAH